MGLFTRDQHSVTSKPLYQVGLQKSLLIVGLGNPGSEYDQTRHNIGFYCLDFFAGQAGYPKWTLKKTLLSQLSLLTAGNQRIILCKPQTFMNHSGQAVQAVQQFYKISAEDTVIVHDELDIPFGQIRLRQGGGSAGHNGLKSVIEHGGSNTDRVRIGIHNSVAAKTDSAAFVLAKFSKAEQKVLPDLAANVSDILNEYLGSGQLPHDTRNFS